MLNKNICKYVLHHIRQNSQVGTSWQHNELLINIVVNLLLSTNTYLYHNIIVFKFQRHPSNDSNKLCTMWNQTDIHFNV